MKLLLSALTVATAVAFAAPAFAADTATCQDRWAKVDTSKTGSLQGPAAQPYITAMKTSGHPAAATDRVTSVEFMTACEAKAFDNMK